MRPVTNSYFPSEPSHPSLTLRTETGLPGLCRDGLHMIGIPSLSRTIGVGGVRHAAVPFGRFLRALETKLKGGMVPCGSGRRDRRPQKARQLLCCGRSSHF